MADNNSVITGTPSEYATVTNVVLDIADNSSFGNGSEGQNVTDNKGGFLAAVDKLTSVHTLGGDEELALLLIPEGVAEGDLGKRSTTTRVVDDIGDDPFQIPISLAEVEAAESSGTLAVMGVGLEDGTSTLTLCTNYSSHGIDL